MNIRHECPMPDLSFAVVAPLLVQVADGTILTAQRWSLEGIWIDPQGHDLERDTVLGVPFQGVQVSFDVTLSPTDDPEHFTFRNLTVRQRETLALFYQGVLSGKMAATGDVITSLDTPVDLVPMGETDAEKAEGLAKAKPRLLRILWNTILYLATAVFLGWFVGGHIWERLSEITLDHGRFVAPIQQYVAPDTGYIERLYVKVGDRVRQGDVIARLEDPDRESDVEEVRAEVRIAEARLQDALARLAEQMQAEPRYRAPLVAEVSHLWEGWRDHHPGTLPAGPLGLIARERLAQFDAGQDVEVGGYHAVRAHLERQVEELDLNLRRWKRELRHRKAAADEYVIRAKADGTVFALPVRKGDYVGRTDLVAEIEDDTARTVVGWVDDRMITAVYVGMPAQVRFSFRGQPRRMKAVVIDLQAGTDTVQPDKFGMVVTLKVEDTGLKTSRKLFRRNAPALIELQRDPLAVFKREAGDEGA